MAEEREEGWADWVGHRTFLFTAILAVLFAAAVFIFIL